MKADTDVLVNKVGQLVVVLIGFFTTGLILLLQVIHGTVPAGHLAVTFFIALGLTVRYWWVILLLEWPFRLIRTVLLLSAWSTMLLVAAMSQVDRTWVLMLAVLCGIGAATEFYNLATQQWKVGSQVLARALRWDHLVGGVAALAAAVVLVGLSAWLPQSLTGWVTFLALGDWARLIQMVASHRRLLHGT